MRTGRVGYKWRRYCFVFDNISPNLQHVKAVANNREYSIAHPTELLELTRRRLLKRSSPAPLALEETTIVKLASTGVSSS